MFLTIKFESQRSDKYAKIEQQMSKCRYYFSFLHLVFNILYIFNMHRQQTVFVNIMTNNYLVLHEGVNWTPCTFYAHLWRYFNSIKTDRSQIRCPSTLHNKVTCEINITLFEMATQFSVYGSAIKVIVSCSLSSHYLLTTFNSINFILRSACFPNFESKNIFIIHVLNVLAKWNWWNVFP